MSLTVLSIIDSGVFAHHDPFQAHPMSSSVTVSMIVDDTGVIFSGYASPEAFVVFTEDGTVFGTVQALKSGYFYRRFGSFNEGLHEVVIYYTDSDNKQSSAVRFRLNLTNQTDTRITNILLPPTIDIDKSEITQNDFVRLRGYTIGDAFVTIFISGANKTKTVQADETGYWSLKLEGEKLEPKRYKIYAKAYTKDGVMSTDSKDAILRVQSNDSSSTALTDSNPLSPTDIDSIDQLYSDNLLDVICDLPTYLNSYDSDTSCKLSDSEFLLAVREWYDKWRTTKNCDVDDDGDCDLTDFSIILYYVE